MKKSVFIILVVILMFTAVVFGEENKPITVGWQSVGAEIVSGYEIVVVKKGQEIIKGIVPQRENPEVKLKIQEKGEYTIKIRSIGTNKLRSGWETITYKKE